jgi:hypothetical protein
MAGRLPIKKVYIDSRFRTKDSISHSNFKFELPQVINLPDNVVMYIDNIIIPNSWITINQENNRLYFSYVQTNPVAIVNDIIEITSNNYTGQSLRDEIQDKFNTRLGVNKVIITYNPEVLLYKLTVEDGYTLKLLTDDEVMQIINNEISWLGPEIKEVKSCNDIITNTIPNKAKEIFTGMIDLRRYSNLFITSSNLSAFSTLGPQGESNILKKVPVNCDYGSIIFDNIQSSHDWVNVSRMLLKTLEFRITDGRGNDIDLRGKHVSFSMVFMEVLT